MHRLAWAWIIGDHPHCLQKMDSVEGVPVIYSLGNFWFNSRTQNSCVVKVTLRAGEMESFSIYSMQTE